jgi:hypothetical protein
MTNSNPDGEAALTAPRRALLALVLLAGIAGTFPATTAAWSPRPLPGYTPAFVTETDVPPPWTDCIWSSAAMLLDKWTAGRIERSHQDLRRLSRDRREGSNLADVQAAFTKLGQTLTYSPDGGEIITWKKLLKRLQAGGGAILLGDYSKLPKHYGRWDPSFWGKTDDLDNHALYLDRYDKRHDRIWVMDPLAPAGWRGEWVPRKALVAYGWRTAFGALYAAMTPAAAADPFKGVELGDASATAAPGTLALAWPIERTPKSWRLPAISVESTVAKLESGLGAADAQILLIPPASDASVATDKGPAASDPPPASPLEQDGHVTAAVALPIEPGAYSVSVALRDPRFGDEVAIAGPYTVYVPGDRRATWELDATARTALVGSEIELAGTITNSGAGSWAEPAHAGSIPAAELPLRQTAIWAHWLPLDDADGSVSGATADATATDAAAPLGAPVRLRGVELGPGESGTIDLTVDAPLAPGRWLLVLDVEDSAGAFAATGSAPLAISVTVAAVPAPEPE